ncbi:MAG: serine O-acetyltransferase, partial [Clostridia bacterium]|nr:serine O-acetyltransferase [Clostridia bacterium]
GAKVLGPFSIGDNTKIAAGSLVLHEIPENCTAVGAPARVVKRDGKRVDMLDQVHIPDPVMQEFEKLYKRIDELESELHLLKGEDTNEGV